MNPIEPDPPFASLFFQRELDFSQGNIGCFCGEGGQIAVSLDSAIPAKEQLDDVVKRIQGIDLSMVLSRVEPQAAENLLNNLLNLREWIMPKESDATSKGRCSPILEVFPKRTAVTLLPFFLNVATVRRLDRFSDDLRCRLFSLQHFTSYPKSDSIVSIPTDHGGIKEMPSGYQLVVSDGAGHHDVKAIGLVAAQLVERTLKRRPFKRMDPKGDKKQNYQSFLRAFNQEYRAQEGANLLEAEILKKSSRSWKIRVANYGDCCLIVLNAKGKIQFFTKDRSREQRADRKDLVGALYIGAGMSDQLIEHADYAKCRLSEGWVIACSDGLITPFRDESGSVDAPRLEWAIRTGHYAPPESLCSPRSPSPRETLDLKKISTPSGSPRSPRSPSPRESLDLKKISQHLRLAAMEAAKELQNGDDTTIIVVKLS